MTVHRCSHPLGYSAERVRDTDKGKPAAEPKPTPKADTVPAKAPTRR